MNSWKVVDVSDPKMMEWMQFVCKKLALKLHPTYLATRQLHVVITTNKRFICNWVKFVNGLIHEEYHEKEGMEGEHLSLWALHLPHHPILHEDFKGIFRKK